MKDYSNIKKYPIGPWDIGLWFNFKRQENIFYYNKKLAHIKGAYFYFESKNKLIRINKRFTTIKRLSPQPKFEPYENELIFYQSSKCSKPWLHFWKPEKNYVYEWLSPFSKWIAEHSTEEVKRDCPFWLDKEFWGIK